MVERRFARGVESLESIAAFVAEFLAAHSLPRTNEFDLNLILEELFTNQVKYNRDGREEIAIGLGLDGDMATIRIRDFGVVPFDLTRAPEVDTNRPGKERRPGGLGIHLVRRLADRLEYSHEDGTSTITVTKQLET